MRFFAACALVVVALALVAAGCGGDDEDTATPTVTETTGGTETDEDGGAKPFQHGTSKARLLGVGWKCKEDVHCEVEVLNAVEHRGGLLLASSENAFHQVCDLPKHKKKA